MRHRPEAGTIPDAPGSYQFMDAEGRVHLRRARPRACAAGCRTTSRRRSHCCPTHPPDGAAGRHRRVDRGPQRGRGALPRVQPHQAAPAPLQHPAARTTSRTRTSRSPSTRSGRGRWCMRGAEAQGRPLLRSVRARVRDPRDPRPPAAHVPDPHVHEQQVRPAPPARPPVPLRAHREVRGAVRRRHRPRRVRRASSRSCSTSSTASTTAVVAAGSRRDARGVRRARVRARGARCATSSRSVRKAIERQQMVGARRKRTSTSSASPRTRSKRRCRSSSCAGAGSSGARASSSTRSRTSRRRRSSPASSSSSTATRRRTTCPQEILVPVEPEDLELYEEFLALDPRRSKVAHPRAAARARSASCSRPSTLNAQEAFARHKLRRASDHNARAARARRAAGGARPARGAAAHRVLRHLAPAGHRDRRVDGRDGRRPRRSAPTTAASRSSTLDGQDDFAAMEEVLTRRFRRYLARARRRRAARASGSRTRRTCCVIDGGKGQLNVAVRVLEELGLEDICVASLAKRSRRCTCPGAVRAGAHPARLRGAVPAAAGARRGPPVRDHVPPPAARQEDDDVGARRRPRPRPDPPDAAAARSSAR